MKKIIYAAMAVVSMSYTAPAMAQSQDLQTKVNAYFTETLKAQQTVLEKADREAFSQNKPSDTKLQLAIKRKDVTDYQKMVWTAWCEANKSLEEQKLMEAEDLKLAKHSSWNIPACLEPDAVMPHIIMVRRAWLRTASIRSFCMSTVRDLRTTNGRTAYSSDCDSRIALPSISYLRFLTRANTIAGGICPSSMLSRSLSVRAW